MIEGEKGQKEDEEDEQSDYIAQSKFDKLLAMIRKILHDPNLSDVMEKIHRKIQKKINIGWVNKFKKRWQTILCIQLHSMQHL